MGQRLWTGIGILILIAVGGWLALGGGASEDASRQPESAAGEVAEQPDRRRVSTDPDPPIGTEADSDPESPPVRGTIRSMSGAPVGGATVGLVRESPGQLPRIRVSVQADAEGRFELPTDAWRDGDRLLVRADGFGAVTRDARPGDRLTLRLPAGTRLSGVVFDEDTRAPVGGARVGVRLAGTQHALTMWVAADEAGRYAFDHLWPTTATVSAYADGFETSELRVLLNGRGPVEHGIPLRRGVTISGVVHRGDDLEDRVVAVEIRVRRANGESTVVATTDDRGRFRAEGVPVLETVLIASATDGTSGARSLWGGRPSRKWERRLSIGVQPPGQVVVVGDGAPVAGARITATQSRLYAPGQLLGVTDAHGRATLPLGGVGSKRLGRIEVRATGWAPKRTLIRTKTAARVELDRGGRLRARFVAAGEPVEGRTVFVQSGNHWFERAVTDDDGQIDLLLHPAHYLVWLPATEWQQIMLPSIEIPAGDVTDLGTIALSPGIEMVGSVQTQTAEPIAGAQVAIVPVEVVDGYSKPLGAAIVWTTDADGRFRVPGLPDGLADVVVSAAGFTEHPVGPVRTSDPFHAILRPFVPAVRGRVLGPDGKPPARAVVTVVRHLPGIDAHRILHQELVGGDGRFETRLHAEPTATYSVSVSSGDRVATTKVQKAPADLRLDLAPGGSVLVRAKDRDGRPASGVAVQLHGAVPGLFAGADHPNTDRDGETRIGPLAPGRIVLSAHLASFPPHLDVVDVRPGAETVVDVRFDDAGSVELQVVDAVGDPIEGATVVAYRPRDREYAVRSKQLHGSSGQGGPRSRGTEMRTPANGVVTAESIAHGTYRVVVRRDGYGETDVEVEVKAGETATVQVALARE